jgi:hypothetical protein
VDPGGYLSGKHCVSNFQYIFLAFGPVGLNMLLLRDRAYCGYFGRERRSQAL